jgi:iron complex transport system ATP-binding protein
MESVRYARGGRDLLSDIDLTVRPAERWALMGHNGSGKSLMLQLASGYILSNGGRITRLGEEDGRSDLRELRKRIGVIGRFVEHHMHPGENALEAVVSGKFATIGIYDAYTEADAARAREMMAITGVENLAGRTFGHLSDGERDRILIARAMMSDVRLLLLDEPCAALDLRGREELLSALARIAAAKPDMGMIMVSHHVEEITPLFTHALLLREGRVIASGPADKTLTDRAVSEALRVRVTLSVENGRRSWRIVENI